jgi:hypothetical protein
MIRTKPFDRCSVELNDKLKTVLRFEDDDWGVDWGSLATSERRAPEKRSRIHVFITSY